MEESSRRTTPPAGEGEAAGEPTAAEGTRREPTATRRDRTGDRNDDRVGDRDRDRDRVGDRDAAITDAHRAGVREGVARTLAQSFCLGIGAVLIAAGVLGFFFGGSAFSTGSNPSGEDFLLFNVNGWHNVVHIASGAFLVLMATRAGSAVIGALIFAAVYAAVAVLGFIDGNDVLNVMTADNADNWLHVGLAAAAFLVALSAGSLGMSARRDRRRLGVADG